MKLAIKIASVIVLLLVSLVMVACNHGAIANSLSLAVTAAELAVPIVGQYANLPPEITAAVLAYLQVANAGLKEAAVILQSDEPAAVQAARITAALSAALKPQLPMGTPQAIVDAVTKVSSAIADVLVNFAQSGKPKMLPPTYHYKISKGDLKKIQEAQERLDKIQQALNSMTVKH